MLSSDIGQAHCDTARYWQDNIPTEEYREAARRALRGRSGARNGNRRRPDRNIQAGRRLQIEGSGAGEGNRTLVMGLEGCRKTLSDQSELKLSLVKNAPFGAKFGTR